MKNVVCKTGIILLTWLSLRKVHKGRILFNQTMQTVYLPYTICHKDTSTFGQAPMCLVDIYLFGLFKMFLLIIFKCLQLCSLFYVNTNLLTFGTFYIFRYTFHWALRLQALSPGGSIKIFIFPIYASQKGAVVLKVPSSILQVLLVLGEQLKPSKIRLFARLANTHIFRGLSGCSLTECPTMHCKLHSAF